jgi:tryptophan 2,3-dioxygenase
MTDGEGAMTELETLLGQRDAALFREDMGRVEQLEVKIANLAAALRRKLVNDCAADLGAALKQFEEELREQRP